MPPRQITSPPQTGRARDTRRRRGRPFVTVTFAQSIDGSIAARRGLHARKPARPACCTTPTHAPTHPHPPSRKFTNLLTHPHVPLRNYVRMISPVFTARLCVCCRMTTRVWCVTAMCITGEPLALSGKESMVMTHRLRTAHGAILVGIGTVLVRGCGPGSAPAPWSPAVSAAATPPAPLRRCAGLWVDVCRRTTPL